MLRRHLSFLEKRRGLKDTCLSLHAGHLSSLEEQRQLFSWYSTVCAMLTGWHAVTPKIELPGRWVDIGTSVETMVDTANVYDLQ